MAVPRTPLLVPVATRQPAERVGTMEAWVLQVSPHLMEARAGHSPRVTVAVAAAMAPRPGRRRMARVRKALELLSQRRGPLRAVLRAHRARADKAVAVDLDSVAVVAAVAVLVVAEERLVAVAQAAARASHSPLFRRPYLSLRAH
jgi:hypothetical protein